MGSHPHVCRRGADGIHGSRIPRENQVISRIPQNALDLYVSRVKFTYLNLVSRKIFGPVPYLVGNIKSYHAPRETQLGASGSVGYFG